MASSSQLRIVPVSEGALLVEYPTLEAVVAHFQALETAQLPGVMELMPAARTILVRFDHTLTTHQQLAAAIRAVAPSDKTLDGGEAATIDVIYDGQDLEEVATMLDMSWAQLIERHTSTTWTVAFIGYAPGFAYCVCDDPIFNVPRRATPRTRIPAGSVGLAGTFSGIYPRSGPGGWQLLGHTEELMFDLNREQPSRLRPGQEVHYRAVAPILAVTQETAHVFDEAAKAAQEKGVEGAAEAAAGEVVAQAIAAEGFDTQPATPEEEAESPSGYVEVLRPGMQLLVEDLGRPGMLSLGVGASGAADRRSLRGANSAVGNRLNEPALEIAAGGTQLRVEADTVIAYTGASGPRSIVSADGAELPLNRGEPTAVEAGDTIRIGLFHRGLRGYIAVRGGFDVPKQLGSSATDTMSGIGPDPLQAGDRLQVGAHPYSRSVAFHETLYPKLPTHEEVVELDVVLGPRTDWFTQAGLDTLVGQEWEVSPHSNRVGVRLMGEEGLERAKEGELISEGAVRGAIQVPPDGKPVIFLADHPVTGGYPIVGAVAEKDIDIIGQLAPGMKVKFHIVNDFAEL